MRTMWCSSCGAEYEVDEAEGRQRGRTCACCKRIEKMEREILLEWERARGYAED